MTLESQVSNLELSKKLKELGVNKRGIFSWSVYGAVGQIDQKWEVIYGWGNESRCSAFTCSELGEMLPDFIKTNKAKNGWNVEYDWRFYQDGKESQDYIVGGDTEADARAKMLVYLLENKLIKL